jgi:hypothetical protein
MPQVIPFAAIGAYLTANSTAIAITLLTTAASYALNSYEANKAKEAAKDAARGQSIQQNIREALGPRYRSYGYDRIGGNIIFEEVSGKSLYYAVALSNGVIDGIERFYINNIECRIDNLGYVTTAPFNSSLGKLVRFELKSGYANQTVSSILSYTFSGVGSNHVGSGIAYLVAEFFSPPNSEAYAAIYNSKLPEVAVLQRGSLIFDPRDPTQNAGLELSWKFSTNPALILMDFISHPDGLGLNRSIFNADSVIKVANYCDQLLRQKDGSYVKRYEMGGHYFSSEDKAAVIQDILNTFAGDIYIDQFGLFAITSHGLDLPSVTITDDIVIAQAADLTVGALYNYSSVRAQYTSDIHGYKEGQVEAAPWIDAEALAHLGRDLPYSFNLRFVNRHAQARRLMKIKFHALNPKWTLKQDLNFEGMQLFGERSCRQVVSDLDIDGDFKVVSVGTDGNFGLAKITAHLESIDPRSYLWDATTEEGTATPLVPDNSDTAYPQTPTNLQALPNSSSPCTALISWAANTNNKTQQFYYKKTSDASYTEVSVYAAQRYVALSGLISGTSYDVAIRVASVAYGNSNYAYLTFVATGSAGTTGPLVYFGAAGSIGKIYVNTQQAVAAKAAYVQYSVVAVGAAADWTNPVAQTLISNQLKTGFEIPTALLTADVYARSVGINGDVGAVSGPATVTIGTAAVNTGSTGTTSTGGQGNGGGNNGNNDGGSSPTPPPSNNTNAGPTNDGGGGNSSSIY